MTPATAVVALLAVLLVFLPAAVLLVRLIGSRLLVGRPAPPGIEPADVTPLSALEVGGFASAAELGALSPRERRFVAGTAAAHLPADTPPAAWSEGARSTADREVPVNAFTLVCPACGAALGVAADVAHYVGSCPSCSRRVAARRRGARVSLTAVDTVRPSRRRPDPRG